MHNYNMCASSTVALYLLNGMYRCVATETSRAVGQIGFLIFVQKKFSAISVSRGLSYHHIANG